MTCVTINAMTTISGTPSNQRMIGMKVSICSRSTRINQIDNPLRRYWFRCPPGSGGTQELDWNEIPRGEFLSQSDLELERNVSCRFSFGLRPSPACGKSSVPVRVPVRRMNLCNQSSSPEVRESRNYKSLASEPRNGENGGCHWSDQAARRPSQGRGRMQALSAVSVCHPGGSRGGAGKGCADAGGRTTGRSGGPGRAAICRVGAADSRFCAGASRHSPSRRLRNHPPFVPAAYQRRGRQGAGIPTCGVRAVCLPPPVRHGPAWPVHIFVETLQVFET
jgi:hypothetical protein